MNGLKKTVSVTEPDGAPFGVLRIRYADKKTVCDLSLVDKNAAISPLTLVLYNGKDYFRTPFCREFTASGDFSSLKSFGVYRDGEYFAGWGDKKYLLSEVAFYEDAFLSAQDEAEKIENIPYDDEQIAEENYYEKEGYINETDEHAEDAHAEECRPDDHQEEVCADEACQDEDDPYALQKSANKPINTTFPTENLRIFSQTSGGEDKKDRINIYAAMTRGERFYSLEKVIPFGRFYKISSGEKYYVLGLLGEDFPYDIIYAVPAVFGKRPKGFENGFFVPSSYFEKEKGFYCKVQSKK